MLIREHPTLTYDQRAYRRTPLPYGTVVRSYGQQYYNAQLHGTAHVIWAFTVNNHLEYVVRRFDGTETEWSDERTETVNVIGEPTPITAPQSLPSAWILSKLVQAGNALEALAAEYSVGGSVIRRLVEDD